MMRNLSEDWSPNCAWTLTDNFLKQRDYFITAIKPLSLIKVLTECIKSLLLIHLEDYNSDARISSVAH